jgi:hypothetical protein
MYWNWKAGGFVLGISFLLAVALVKPIGVSTQFVILDGMIAGAFNSELIKEDKESKTGYASSNAYLNKSGGKYAKSAANPINYSFVFVLCMVFGGFIGKVFTRSENSKTIDQVPACHKQRFGETTAMRYLFAFVGGIIVLWGARLAGGCTSGHMMSGMMQTSVSGYLFAFAAFAAAIPVAIFIYRKEEN